MPVINITVAKLKQHPVKPWVCFGEVRRCESCVFQNPALHFAKLFICRLELYVVFIMQSCRVTFLFGNISPTFIMLFLSQHHHKSSVYDAQVCLETVLSRSFNQLHATTQQLHLSNTWIAVSRTLLEKMDCFPFFMLPSSLEPASRVSWRIEIWPIGFFPVLDFAFRAGMSMNYPKSTCRACWTPNRTLARPIY